MVMDPMVENVKSTEKQIQACYHPPTQLVNGVSWFPEFVVGSI